MVSRRLLSLVYRGFEGEARNSYRLRHGLAKITDLPGFYVRVVDYEIPDRGDGDEIITLVTNITDPDEIPATTAAAIRPLTCW
jgi:hypothetical protein